MHCEARTFIFDFRDRTAKWSQHSHLTHWPSLWNVSSLYTDSHFVDQLESDIYFAGLRLPNLLCDYIDNIELLNNNYK